MQLSNDTGNRNRNGDMDMEVLSRQLGHGDLNQSFTQEANEEYRKLIVGGDGINKDDFDGMCNVMELVTKWKREGRSPATILDAEDKLKAKITNLLRKGATKDQIADSTWKCLAEYRGKGGKKIQRGGIGINNMILGIIAIALGASYMDRNKQFKPKPLKRKKSLKRVKSVWGDL